MLLITPDPTSATIDKDNVFVLGAKHSPEEFQSAISFVAREAGVNMVAVWRMEEKLRVRVKVETQISAKYRVTPAGEVLPA